MHAAYAQEATQSMQRVEVTGSRIRQVDLETAQPIQVMNQEQIQKSGLITVGDILNQLSSVGTPEFSRGGALTSNLENGGQYISMRNLGANRMLVLVDGKRWTQTVNGYTDMSTIPSAMIERIEVLKDGASSIYGSDAIAGVVNIILKKRLEGGQLSLYTGANDKGDGRNKDFSLSYGTASDKASMMFGLSHTEQGVVWPNKRDITRYPNGPAYPNDGLGSGPWGNVSSLNEDSPLQQWVINHPGGVGADPRDPNNYHPYDGDVPDDKFNSASQMMFQMPNRLDTLFTKGTLELPYGMQFSTTAMYSERKSTAQIAGYPLRSDVQRNYPVYIDRNSYYNPFGEDLSFSRRTIEMPRITDNENSTLHVDATLSGDFEFKGKAFNWDVGYNHSKVQGTIYSSGNVNLLNLKRALGPSFMNGDGVVQCGTPGAPISLTECTPWNIIGGPSASNAQVLNYVMANGQSTYGSTINSATANIGGEVLELPAGMLGVAGGIEHREVRGFEKPGQFEQSGYSTDLAGNPTSGKYQVREAYLETNIPLLKGVAFADLLSLNLASRYSDYSNFGSTRNSKASFMWKPIKDLLVRGTWAQGFRAPTVGDTFGGGSQSYDTFLDPCDTQFGEAARNPVVAARCAAAGAGAGFRQVDQTNTAITSTRGTQSIAPFMSGEGNSSLQPERAKTNTLGLVYSPAAVPGLSGSLDWYNIKVTNLITGISANDTVNYCYVQDVPSYCGSIVRNSAGQIVNLSHGNINLGSLETEGYDLSLSYRFPRSQYGQFTLRSDSTFVTKYNQDAGDGSDPISYLGEYDEGGYAYYRAKSNISLDWSRGNWSATWTARYFGRVKDMCYDEETCANLEGVANFGTGYNKLGSMVYNDVSVSYKTAWNGTIMIGANNVFDKKPRTTVLGAASSSAVDANLPIDRFVYVRYNQAF
jgi:iron complex outermembrane receptor protein